MKEIHERTHPGARLGRVPDDRLEDDPEQDHPEVGDLVADLEAEAEEEDREDGSGMIFGFDDLDPEE